MPQLSLANRDTQQGNKSKEKRRRHLVEEFEHITSGCDEIGKHAILRGWMGTMDSIKSKYNKT